LGRHPKRFTLRRHSTIVVCSWWLRAARPASMMPRPRSSELAQTRWPIFSSAILPPTATGRSGSPRSSKRSAIGALDKFSELRAQIRSRGHELLLCLLQRYLHTDLKFAQEAFINLLGSIPFKIRSGSKTDVAASPALAAVPTPPMRLSRARCPGTGHPVYCSARAPRCLRRSCSGAAGDCRPKTRPAAGARSMPPP
jgi:hypothetical protein